MLLRPTGNHTSNLTSGHRFPNTSPHSTRSGLACTHYREIDSKVGRGPTSSAMTQESGKCTPVRLSFPRQHPSRPLLTWPCPRLPQEPPLPLPPPAQPSPGSPPPGLHRTPKASQRRLSLPTPFPGARRRAPTNRRHISQCAGGPAGLAARPR